MSGNLVLVVDDNRVNLKLFKELIACEGYDVDTAEDAGEALDQIELRRPSLILMDIQMPGMDGLALTRRLKADPETRDILIVALTANAMKGDEEKARAAGCDGYITKPIDTRSFGLEIARWLASAPAEPTA